MPQNAYTLLEEREMPEVGGRARLWQHNSSRAQVLSITNQDENKCFGVSFYTPPVNSTGVAHILEHSVLCGSTKYPLKEPFAELLKGSLQTFLNAFTFPDKTCYPVASANLQDFYNLIDVYLDAVFHPLLSKDTFHQEGWHIEAESADAPWTFKGVVYNEMKGVYSSPEAILGEQSQQQVFPDNLYSLDSGGNPERIPDLTYEEFCDFHQRYYQPGNARFFFWGDDPEETRLAIIDKAIGSASPVHDLPQVKLQAAPAKDRYAQIPYAAADGEDRAMLTVNWLLAERGNVEEALKMEMLEHILEGLPGSPLRRALMESGLGEDTIGCGLETDLRQMYYSTGLKGIMEADAGKVETLIMQTLADMVKNGIEPDAVEAALNTVEFALRESNTGRFPRGLAAMIMALSTWLYGANPLDGLAWEKPLAKIKKAVAGGEKIFEKTIADNFLNKPHVCVTLLPDAALAQTRSDAEKARLAEIQAQTGPDQREELVEETRRLIDAQLKPDNPEDLAKIPSLTPADLPKECLKVPTSIYHYKTCTFLNHALPTRGVAYATVLLPVRSLPPALVPLLPLFCRSLTECGSAHYDYTELGKRIAAKTGGLSASMLTGSHLGSRDAFAYLSISGKAVYDKLPDLFDLMREILLEPQKNKDIMRQRLGLMLLEARARLEHALQAAGHSSVALRLAAHFNGDAALTEAMSGISQLEYLRGLVANIEKESDALLGNIEELRGLLISSASAIASLAADASAVDSLQGQTEKFLAALPQTPTASIGTPIAAWPDMANLPAGEAFITPGQVNYVGKGANVYNLGYKFSGAANVIMRWLRMGRLWEEVRVAGGAYGAFCNLDRITGTLICSSYRDPNIDATLSAYDGLGQYLHAFKPTKAQIEQAIVGAVGALDAYMLPDGRAAQALAWYLSGITPEIRQKTRDEMFATTAREFNDFAGVMEAFAQNGDVCVLGGAQAKEAAQEHGWKEHKLV